MSSERAENLVACVKDELQGFRLGQVQIISTLEELRAQFGYATTASIHPILNRVGLIAERRLLLRETGGYRLNPSRETAWVLGVLSGGGSVDVDKGKVALTSQDDQLLKAFKTNTEAILPVEIRINSYPSSGTINKEARFDDRRISRVLGDFRGGAWTQTIQDKHNWLLEDHQFIWGFLEGLSEVCGSVNRKGITFWTHRFEVAEFLSELMIKVGLGRPSVLKKEGGQRIRGIVIRNPQDKKEFAVNVWLNRLIRDKALEKFRSTDEQIKVANKKPKIRKPRDEKSNQYFGKRNNLISYIKDELARYKAGELSALSSSEELRRRFGYVDVSAINRHLRLTGLGQERRQTDALTRPKAEFKRVRKSEGHLIAPSMDWAWMMGILAMGGSVAESGVISFTNRFPELREVIQLKGEDLFHVNMRPPRLYGDAKSPTLVFSSVKIARELGDFTKDAWVETILERHSWIFQNYPYRWAFLEGIFETQGRIYTNFRKRFENIRLNALSNKSTNFLARLLVTLGIEDPSVVRNKYTHDGVTGLDIHTLKDVRMFAQNIHSVVTDTELRLQSLRTLPEVGFTTGVRKYSDADLLVEWSKAKAILEHDPSLSELDILNRLGLISCNYRTFVDRFGRIEQNSNVALARRRINDEIEAQSVSPSFSDIEIIEAKEAFDQYQDSKRSLVPKPTIKGYDAKREKLVSLGNQNVRDLLSPREWMIIDQVFGLEGDGRGSLNALASDLGLSRARIYQIKDKALVKVFLGKSRLERGEMKRSLKALRLGII